MKIYSIYDPEFKEYGKIINDNFDDILTELAKTECPEDHTMYVASDKNLESLPSFKEFKNDYYGGMPIQIGYCNGHNNKLNCLEYHRDSELNLANEDFILLLARRSEIENGTLDTGKVKAFMVPSKTCVEVFATTLHYAPCGVNGNGFRVLVVLPKGTNVKEARSKKEPLLWATNKWLLAHEESNEAKKGAHIGLVGKNITL